METCSRCSGERGEQEEHGESGAAPVDFVLLIGLLTVLFLMLLQLGFTLHVRNVLTSAAAEGARYGANADFADHESAAAAQARTVISSELSARFAEHVSATTVMVGGQPVVEVDVSAPMPLIALWGTARTITVRGHALQEGG